MNKHFSWNRSGLNQKSFVALTNLLSLRDGGQIEEHSNSDDAANNGGPTTAVGSGSRPAKYGNGTPISSMDVLKREFLDQLAQLASKKKGGKFVACAAMRETDNKTLIWITRNDGFLLEEEQDKIFFDELANFLEILSMNPKGMVYRIISLRIC